MEEITTMSRNVLWTEIARIPVTEETKVLIKTLRQVKLSEDGSYFLVLSGKQTPQSAAEKEQNEKDRLAKREAKKAENKVAREKALKEKKEKTKRHKAEKEVLLSKMRKYRKEIKALSAERDFVKAGQKQDQLSELQKEFNQLKSLKRSEILEKY